MKKILFTLFFVASTTCLFGQNALRSGSVSFRKIQPMQEFFQNYPPEVRRMLRKSGLQDTMIKEYTFFFTPTKKQSGLMEPPIPDDTIVSDMCRIPKNPFNFFDISTNSVIFAGQDETDNIERYFRSPLVREGKNTVFVGNEPIAGFSCRIFEQKTPSDTIRYWVTDQLPETAGLVFFDTTVARGAVLKIKYNLKEVVVDSVKFELVEPYLTRVDTLQILPSPTLVAANPNRWKMDMPIPDFTAFDMEGTQYSPKSLGGKKTIFVFLPNLKHDGDYEQPVMKAVIKKWSAMPNVQVVGIFCGSPLAVPKVLEKIGTNIPIIPNARKWADNAGMMTTPDYVMVNELGIIRHISSIVFREIEKMGILKKPETVEESVELLHKSIFE